MFKRLVIAMAACMVCGIALAQNLKDCVYLKNGSILKGTILEQIPNETIKIQTGDGSVFVCDFDQVEKITRELAGNAWYNGYPEYQSTILSYAGNGQVQVLDGNTRLVLSASDPELAKYMPLQYDNYVKNVQLRNKGMHLFIAGVAMVVAGGVFSNLDDTDVLGPLFACTGTVLWITGIPLWCIGTAQQKNAIATSNAYQGNYRYSIGLAPSCQQMNTSAITGRNETAVGATLSFRF